MGIIAIVAILLHTARIEKPREFANLAIYQFFALSIIAISIIFSVAFFPEDIRGNDLPISRVLYIDDENRSQWVFSVGASTKGESTIGLQIPFYVIITGVLGAYIRYLYLTTKQTKDELGEHLINLKRLYIDHKALVNKICKAAGFSYEELQKKNKGKIFKAKYVKIKHILKELQEKHDEIYNLPPTAIGPFSNYLNSQFDLLTEKEAEYEESRFEISYMVNHKTLSTIGFFFLAPLLAIIAWLMLSLGGMDEWRAFAIVSFGAGLTADSIVKKLWKTMGELGFSDDDESTTKKEKKNKWEKAE